MDTVKPAEVSILALYNPSLGRSDETLHDQILYYYASDAYVPKKRTDEPSGDRERTERNERLRQIGLAQGLVEFGKCVSQPTPCRLRSNDWALSMPLGPSRTRNRSALRTRRRPV